MRAPRGTCPGPDAAAGARGLRGGEAKNHHTRAGRCGCRPPRGGARAPPPIPIPIAAPAMFRFILAWHCPWATCSQRPGKHGAGGWQQARLQGAGDV